MRYQDRIKTQSDVLRPYIPNSELRVTMCWHLVLALLFVLLSFAFYMVSAIDGVLFGTPQGEIDEILQEKMKGIIQVVE